MNAVDRAATRERLRRIIREIESRPPRPMPVAVPPRPVSTHRLGHEWRDCGGAMVRECWFEDAHLHGRQALGGLRDVDGNLLALLSGDADLRATRTEELRFLDIEATGLGGTGAMVFLVAMGQWSSDGFLLRQYLAAAPPAEPALLQQLVRDCRDADGEPVLVTYNGSTYDAPMLDARGTLHRMRTGFEVLAHLDLLRTVRRGLRDAVRPHRLSHIEALMLDVARYEDEVGGADVPGWYFRFLRSGDARMLTPVVEHNAADVLSLAAMLARLGTVLAGRDAATPLEHLLLGRLYASAGRYEEAVEHLGKARAGMPGGTTSHVVAMEMARLLRRLERRPEAALLWREVAGGDVAPASALVELAKHYEHQVRDYRLALDAVHRALAIVGPTPALLHRRARLLRRNG